MANTRILRRRMKSVKNIAQITKAMEMVAATKMRRAQSQALSGRPYSTALNFSLSEVTSKIDPTLHKFLQPNGAKQIGVLVITTDKSLCGALNTNVFRYCQNFLSGHLPGEQRKHLEGAQKFLFYTVGRKGRDFIVKTGKNLEADFENLEIVTSQQAYQIAKLLMDQFLTEKLGEVYIIYPEFISTLRQEPKIVKLLPISQSDIVSSISEEKRKTDNRQPITNNQSNEFIFEPDLMSLLDFVLKHFIESKVYQALLEAKASEHSSRMIAMQNATENAKDLVEDLTLTYNQTRQDGITKELLEITTAQAALE